MRLIKCLPSQMLEGADNQNFLLSLLVACCAIVEEPADPEALGQEHGHEGARRDLVGLGVIVVGSEMLHGVEEVQTSVGAARRFVMVR